ncbi:aminotransferase-like domain-containing protein [Enhygromyxa salina]|uniref:aminotransferase-like domain-containing protein n=1 Tax=Enhygromyxa salina TaxID=215803 RepID=UPI0015E5BF05|nr:PLP-dependent aminotransferase family protein [Enhygromyxa salina]
MRLLLDSEGRSDLVSFAIGVPPADSLPSRALARAFDRLLADPQALMLNPPSHELRRGITDLMAKRGVDCGPNTVFLTDGAQQALDLLVRLLVRPGDEVLVDPVTYTGMLMALQPSGGRASGVEGGAGQTMDLDALAKRLERGPRPAFIYTMADGHNPLGVSMGLDQRERLVELGHRHGVPIVEDDPYGWLDLDEEWLPPLHALNPDEVIYVGTFSKIAGPALRCGWILAPQGLRAKLSLVRDLAAIDSANLVQQALGDLLGRGELEASLTATRVELRRRRAWMLTALADHFSTPTWPSATWTSPNAGLFVWLQLAGVDAAARLPAAIERGVAYVPGSAFAVGSSEAELESALRLSFGGCDRAAIDIGVERLAEVLRS